MFYIQGEILELHTHTGASCKLLYRTSQELDKMREASGESGADGRFGLFFASQVPGSCVVYEGNCSLESCHFQYWDSGVNTLWHTPVPWHFTNIILVFC